MKNMKMRHKALLPLLICMTLPALAHQGANGVVKVRMDAMGVVQNQVKTLGDMARGRRAVDLDAARGALEAIADEAARMPALFHKRDLSGPSEAVPAIWDDFDGFTAEAAALENLARAEATTLDDPAALKSLLRSLGRTCASCHGKYRQQDE